MNNDASSPGTQVRRHARGRPVVRAIRAYFGYDTSRTLQTALGLLWLLDGALQFQPFMYSHGFVRVLLDGGSGQPSWLTSSIRWSADVAQTNLALWNTLFALTQVLIGIGLLHRRTVRIALAVSLAWALIVWWVGEAFGMLFTNTASPLAGAPGPVLLYAIVALTAWPTDQPGGLLGVRGARAAWATLWLVAAWMWLLNANSSADATRRAVDAAPSGTGWLSALQAAVASATNENGLPIALALALVSAAIAVAVALNWRSTPFVALGVALSFAYWVIGQGFGGIFTGTATDPGAGPPLALFAFALYSINRGSMPLAGHLARSSPMPAPRTVSVPPGSNRAVSGSILNGPARRARRRRDHGST